MNDPPAPLWHAYDQYRVARSGMASQRHDHVSRAKIHEAISRNFDWPPGNYFTNIIEIVENFKEKRIRFLKGFVSYFCETKA